MLVREKGVCSVSLVGKYVFKKKKNEQSKTICPSERVKNHYFDLLTKHIRSH